MNPEREIISLWLTKKGFFAVNSIPLENNKIIDILAIKLVNGKLEKIMHVETASSISSLDNVPMSTYAEKFNDTNVVRTVNSTIKAMIGMDCEYGKMLVIGNTNHPGQFEKMDGIKIISFENILLEVMNDMNKQSYRNEITRTLQLVKYLLLAKPSKMAAVI